MLEAIILLNGLVFGYLVITNRLSSPEKNKTSKIQSTIIGFFVFVILLITMICIYKNGSREAFDILLWIVNLIVTIALAVRLLQVSIGSKDLG